MNSQTEKILNHLEAGLTITPLQALNLFGCFRLGARIHELKREGYQIEKVMTNNVEKRFAMYYLLNRKNRTGNV